MKTEQEIVNDFIKGHGIAVISTVTIDAPLETSVKYLNCVTLALP